MRIGDVSAAFVGARCCYRTVVNFKDAQNFFPVIGIYNPYLPRFDLTAIKEIATA